jgi:hypothetical protein
MKETSHIPLFLRRTFGAWVCLLAVVLFWAPLWAAAWQAQGMACCEGGMCASHPQGKPNQSRPKQDSSVNCEHHGGGTPNCSMSCGQESSNSLTSAVIFVLPAPAIISQPVLDTLASPSLEPAEFMQSFEPLSPPPRTSLLSL